MSDSKTIWRNAWLNAINELTSGELQERTWIDPEIDDIYWNYDTFQMNYIDEVMMLEPYEYFIEKGFVTKAEYQAVKSWHESFINYESTNEDGFENDVILNDPGWKAIVRKGEHAKTELARLLTGEEKLILTAVKEDNAVPPYIQALTDDQQEWPEFADDEDLAKHMAKEDMLTNDSFGDTPEERLSAISRVKWLARILNTISIGIFVWLMFNQEPNEYMLAIGIIFPLVLIGTWMMLKGKLRMSLGEHNFGYPNIITGFLMSCVSTLKTFLTLDIFDYTNAFIYGSIVFVILQGLILSAERKIVVKEKDLETTVLRAVVLGVYSFCTCLFINVHYSQADPTIYKVKILSKDSTSSYMLHPEAWGTPAEAKNLKVSQTYYNMVEEGDSIIILVTKGALDIPYYQVLEPVP